MLEASITENKPQQGIDFARRMVSGPGSAKYGEDQKFQKLLRKKSGGVIKQAQNKSNVNDYQKQFRCENPTEEEMQFAQFMLSSTVGKIVC